MKNFTYKLICFAMVFSCLSLTAQEKNVEQFRNCATDEYNAQLLIDNPNMMGSETFERQLAPRITEIKRQLESGSMRALQFTIPVVVHVIHNGEPIGTGANISDAQVISQIQVLNDDYRRAVGSRGFNAHPDGADVEVEFCLAKQDPDGCVTTGINRIDMSAVSTSWSGPGGNTDTVLKPATFWDASQYMNMWSVNFSDNTLLGFAQFPGGPANSDGVVANYTYFGSNDATGVTIPGAFNLGRTMTHEVGHYLGLYHTFQGGTCAEGATSGDFCADTPAQNAPNNSNCPVGSDHCPSGDPDMIENYMDYTTDVCMNIFTNEQKARVIAVMQAGNNRPNTTTSDKCTPLADVSNDGSIEINQLVPVPCTSDLVANVRIQNFGTVALTSATVTYDVDGGTSTDISWTGNLAEGEFEDIDLMVTTSAGAHVLNVSIASPNGNADQRSCNDDTNADFTAAAAPASIEATDIYFTITTDNYSGETTWSIVDSNGTVVGSDSYDGDLDDNSTFEYTIPVGTNECYTFVINDSYGDGICCDYGDGSYELRVNTATGASIASGGDFAFIDSVNFLANALSVDDYFAGSNLYVYPNPTNNQLNIKLGNTNDLPNSYEIVNMLGQSITKSTIVTNEDLAINTSTLSNGMYFIRIIKDDASVTLPFIKK
ncbi:M43 family zinc metalloprotease [Psychroserpens luteus]|uniref:M43 family zinc metalloprotease n=1 Tax=Psychroserpens luteus TaxID=1434066 RepID=A0ABW5ZSS0_9FLAO|nr:M43 family zinc metalloprotease [Psychroserpens luteus]